jgi:hypothetical protein
MKFGVLAQLVERLNGIEEVGGSIPPGSMFLIVTEGLTPKRDPGGLFPIGGLSGTAMLPSILVAEIGKDLCHRLGCGSGKRSLRLPFLS